MNKEESSDEAVEVSEMDETVCENSPDFHANQEEDSFMKIRSNQKQRLLARNRRIMGLRKENQSLKKV